MPLVLQVVLTGLAAGAVYGVFAVAYSVVYRLTGVVHFALGELSGAAVFLVLWVAAGTGPVTRTNVSGARLAGGIGAAAVLSIGAGLVAYILAVRPFLRRGSTVGWIGGTVALAFLIRSVLAASFVRPGYVFPDILPFDRIGTSGVIKVAGASLQVRSFFVVGAGALLAAAAAALLYRTRWGRALRAVAADEVGARLAGVPVDRYLTIAFAFAGLLAMLAAVASFPGGTVTVDSGALLGVKGLVAAVVARFRIPWQAFVAGLGLGVVEASVVNLHLGGLRLGAAYGDVVPLGIVLVAIALRSRRASSSVAA